MDDAVPASGWMSVDLGRITAGTVAPRAVQPPSAAPSLTATVAPAPSGPEKPVEAGDAALEAQGSTPREKPVEELDRADDASLDLSPMVSPPDEALVSVPHESRHRPSVRADRPRRGDPRRERPEPEPYRPPEPLRRVPERDVIVVRHAAQSAAAGSPEPDEPVLDLAVEATRLAPAPSRRRWWLAALLVCVMVGGLAYGFTRLGERSVISVPDPGRRDTLVT